MEKSTGRFHCQERRAHFYPSAVASEKLKDGLFPD